MCLFVTAGLCLRKCSATVFSSTDFLSLLLTLSLHSVTRISPVTNNGSYLPFIPLRNLWSRRDIVPCQFSDRQLRNNPPSEEEASLAACVHERIIHVLCCERWQVSVHAIRGFLCTLSNGRDKKNSDPLTPAAQSPSAGCRETDLSQYRSCAPPSPLCSLQYVDLCKIQLQSSAESKDRGRDKLTGSYT